MDNQFDANQAKEFLKNRELEKRKEEESHRQAILTLTLDTLQRMFKATSTEVYLVGSILKPYLFRSDSDIDIVLKNFQGDRFDVWIQIESILKKNVEIILFETCHFQEYIINYGYKVL